MASLSATRSEAYHKLVDIIASSGWHIDRLEWRVREMLRGYEWAGKDILEVGCGKGHISLFLATTGARKVMGIEPEQDGSSHGMQSEIVRRMNILNLDNFNFAPVAFDETMFAPESFDVVFCINVIEHIAETRRPLDSDPEAHAAYEQFFRGVRQVLRDKGRVYIVNCSRYSLWAYVRWLSGYRLPIPTAHSVRWEIHQRPAIWRQFLQDAGFSDTEIHWRISYPFRRFGWLSGTSVFNFFTTAEYTVMAEK